MSFRQFLEILAPGYLSANLFRAELICVLVVFVAAVLRPQTGIQYFYRAEQVLGRIANSRRLSLVIVGVSVLILRGLLLPFVPIPVPHFLDEYSYLLAADTFSHGRLANETHPMWQHFESVFIGHRPTYHSMHPPMQGFILAVGQVLTGVPWVGVLMSAALMCVSLCWMLQAWLPPRWALMGGLLAVLRLGVFSDWVNSYWGGAHSAIGGALVFGALPRLIRTQKKRYAYTLGIGFAILANSRPLEGMFLFVMVGGALLWWTFNRKIPYWKDAIPSILFPLTCVLGSTLVFMGYYNWRVFGDVFTPPYQLNRIEYGPAPVFIWQNPPSTVPNYRHESLKRFYIDYELKQSYEASRSWPGAGIRGLRKIGIIASFYLGPVLTLPFLMVPWVVFHPRLRLVVFVLVAMMVIFMTYVWFFPQYTAPLACLIYVLLLQAIRILRSWKWQGRRAGLLIARSIPAICLIMFIARVEASVIGQRPSSPGWNWFSSWPGNLSRAKVVKHLESTDEKHLVIVRCASDCDYHRDWIHNLANIDDAKVVWAREINEKADQELIKYFRGRRVWLLRTNREPVKIVPHPLDSK